MQNGTVILRRVALGACLALALAVVVAAKKDKDKDKDDLLIVHPPAGNPASGIQPNRIADNFSLLRLAQGSDPIENPSGVITKFGLLSTGTRTEPDENLYLEFSGNPGGPTAGYDYGHHFLYQGHENGSPLAYVTRINLDVADPAHRITLLTPVNPVSGQTGLGSLDGSTWDPFTRTLLFTQEAGSNGGVIEIPAAWTSTAPPARRSLDCIVGKAGYEGIHPDDKGNLILAEDVGGVGVSNNPLDMNATPKSAKQPNSFIYRFEPYNPYDLGEGGKLYALQVRVGFPLAPLTFTPSVGAPTVAQAFADTYSDAQKFLREPGTSWPTQWVLVHDTGTSLDLNTCASFNANTAAKAAHATPFKRPENLVFMPGSNFNTFVFDETGDTDATAGNVEALADRGAWGSIFRVDFPWGSPNGEIRIVVVGDAAHASFDNVAFADGETILVTEDRGDTLHDQLNLLDSVWAFDVVDHDTPPRRLIALGRDPVSAPVGEEDNEPTGIHVSDGGESIREVMGAQVPETKAVHEHQIDTVTGSVPPGLQRSRWFLTEQHGLNQLFEIFLKK